MTEDMSALVHQLQTQALTERMEAMQRLTAGFAHALRNAVNGARLQLALLERRLPRDGQVDRTTAAVGDELIGLTELLDDFLLFARPSPLALEDQDVVALVRDSVAEEQAFAADNHMTLRFAPAMTQARFAVDAAKLSFIVGELVHNAIEAGLPGGHVDITLDVTAEHVRLDVLDDGMGVAPNVQGRIYEPFYSTRERGRGMGLAIVHAFVSQHGGTIELIARSRETRFVVTIPKQRA